MFLPPLNEGVLSRAANAHAVLREVPSRGWIHSTVDAERLHEVRYGNLVEREMPRLIESLTMRAMGGWLNDVVREHSTTYYTQIMLDPDYTGLDEYTAVEGVRVRMDLYKALNGSMDDYAILCRLMEFYVLIRREAELVDYEEMIRREVHPINYDSVAWLARELSFEDRARIVWLAPRAIMASQDVLEMVVTERPDQIEPLVAIMDACKSPVGAYNGAVRCMMHADLHDVLPYRLAGLSFEDSIRYIKEGVPVEFATALEVQ